MSITTPMSCSISAMVVPNSSFTSRTKRHMSSFSSEFMPAIGSSEEQEVRLGGKRPAELHPLLQPVGQPPRPAPAGWPRLWRNSMTFSTCARCSISSRRAGPQIERLPQEVPAHHRVAPGHDVVERAHTPEQGDVLEGAGDSLARRLVRPHPRRPGFALVGDGAVVRVVETVDHLGASTTCRRRSGR